MYSWVVTLAYNDGTVVETSYHGISIADLLRGLLTLNRDSTFNHDIERIDVRRVKEHRDAE